MTAEEWERLESLRGLEGLRVLSVRTFDWPTFEASRRTSWNRIQHGETALIMKKNVTNYRLKIKDAMTYFTIKELARNWELIDAPETT